MKVHTDSESFRPKTVTFETEDEWRVFLAILGNTRMVAEAIIEAEATTTCGFDTEKVDAILDGMMTGPEWNELMREL
jgi:hypothetical protein